ncbi:hypothetical protein ACHAP3_010161 [Botrytis cinerea]
MGEKCVGDQKFGDGGAVCNVVCGTVTAEEKGGDRCFGGIVSRCGPKLEEMEDCESGDEEGDAPEYRIGNEEEVEGSAHGNRKDDTNEERSQCDSRQRFRLTGKELLLELSDSFVNARYLCELFSIGPDSRSRGDAAILYYIPWTSTSCAGCARCAL